MPPIIEDDAQRLVERCDRIAGMGAVIGRRGHVLAVDDAPMARFQDRVVHIGMHPALPHCFDRLIGEADGRIGERQ